MNVALRPVPPPEEDGWCHRIARDPTPPRECRWCGRAWWRVQGIVLCSHCDRTVITNWRPELP